MKKTLEVLNQMVADEVIGMYAIAGAVAAYNYIEPTMIEDLDVVVSFDDEARQSVLVTPTPIISYLSSKGHAQFSREGIVTDAWPVRFLPAASYPDVSDILQRKAEGRKDNAARSLGDKIARMEAMRERLRPLKRLRETREGIAAGLGESDASKTK